MPHRFQWKRARANEIKFYVVTNQSQRRPEHFNADVYFFSLSITQAMNLGY
jgi:hypothetical protein